MKKLLAPAALILSLALGASAAPDAIFDGARAFGGGIPVPVAAGPRRPSAFFFRPASVQAAVASSAPAVAPAPAAVEPSSARGLTSGFLGLYPEDEFVLGTGRCVLCRAPEQGKWYFPDDVIATPKSGPAGLVWIGSHEMVEGVKLSADGASVTLKDGSVVPFELAAKIDSNRSFYDASSLAYLQGRTVRVRGEFVVKDGVRTLVARTIWPEDYRIDAANLKEADAKNAADVDALVAADKGGAIKPFQTRLLWERPGSGRVWEGMPVMGFMLNGAQGDDDEALAGHSSLFTGRYGPGGSMADWMFDNFYDMNTVSEKGIVASMVPMDKYMTDLNSGQSWYRPSYMLVMVMKDARVPLKFQESFKEQYAKYYAQDLKYDKTHKNCTALIADPVREEGWKFPETGKTPSIIARLISKAVALASKDPAAGEQIYQSLREEPTRSFPRASFNAVGGDLLSMAGAFGADPSGREYSPLENMIREDLVAILFVRLPQIPSSRKFGRDPVSGVTDYFLRAPADRSKWQTVPSFPRPFPPPR
ncbi:MAG: hypothetical protein PHS14_04560 [Elusimicrobia bacterium]|nr:hypothetical protein [Elusimicrobiota bacterium]